MRPAQRTRGVSPAARRSRAETFSAFTAQLPLIPAVSVSHAASSSSSPSITTNQSVTNQSVTTNNNNPTTNQNNNNDDQTPRAPMRLHNRSRTGSLSLPKNSIADAFGPSLFASDWTPSSSSSSAYPLPIDHPQIAHFAEGNPTASDPSSSSIIPAHIQDAADDFESADTNALARTLDYLGLDDPIFDSQSSAPRPSSNIPENRQLNLSHLQHQSHIQSMHSPHLHHQLQPLQPQQTSMHIPFREPQQSIRTRSVSVSFAQTTSLLGNKSIVDSPAARTHIASNTNNPISTTSITAPSSTKLPSSSARLRSSTIAFLETSHIDQNSNDADSHYSHTETQPSPEPTADPEPAWSGHPGNTPHPIQSTSHEQNQTQQESQGPHSQLMHQQSSNAITSKSQTKPNSPNNKAPSDNSSPLSTDAAAIDPYPPSRSLWVGNYDPSLSQSEITAIFSQYGHVDSLRILPERECIFVHFRRLDDAIIAKQELQGSRMGNCIIQVGFGKPETQSDSPAQQPTKSLWIGSISPSTSPSDLEAAFSTHGQVESARVLSHKNCGFVNFLHLADAIKARNDMNGTELHGSVVKIGYAKVPGGGGGGVSSTSLGLTDTAPSSAPISPSLPGATSTSSPTSSHVATSSLVRQDSVSQAGSNALSSTLATISVAVSATGSPSTMTVHVSDSPLQQADDTILSGIISDASSPAWPSLSRGNSSPVMEPKKESLPQASHQTQQQPLGLYAVHAQMGQLRQAQQKVTYQPTKQEVYASTIPPIPAPRLNRKIDQIRLREIRRRLDTQLSHSEIDNIYHEIVNDAPELCADYIGNVVVQKVVERSSESNKLVLIQKVAPHIAALGIHKNGTWAVQKIIDCCITINQITAVTDGIRPYTPPLLLDQFGNYVVQCCLRLGPARNQFIFDAMAAKVVDIGLGRFGARAMRACLENQHTTKRQQKQVSIAIVNNATQFFMNSNGIILITWLMDMSSLPGRYRVLATVISPSIVVLCTHKLASNCVLKIVTQGAELEAHDLIIKAIFDHPSNLQHILMDPVHGVSTIYKILSSGCASTEELVRLADRIRAVLPHVVTVNETSSGYKRLFDDLASIPTGEATPMSPALTSVSAAAVDDCIVSPHMPHASFFTNTIQPFSEDPGATEVSTTTHLVSGVTALSYAQVSAASAVSVNGTTSVVTATGVAVPTATNTDMSLASSDPLLVNGSTADAYHQPIYARGQPDYLSSDNASPLLTTAAVPSAMYAGYMGPSESTISHHGRSQSPFVQPGMFVHPTSMHSNQFEQLHSLQQHSSSAMPVSQPQQMAPTYSEGMYHSGHGTASSHILASSGGGLSVAPPGILSSSGITHTPSSMHHTPDTYPPFHYPHLPMHSQMPIHMQHHLHHPQQNVPHMMTYTSPNGVYPRESDSPGYFVYPAILSPAAAIAAAASGGSGVMGENNRPGVSHSKGYGYGSQSAHMDGGMTPQQSQSNV